MTHTFTERDEDTIPVRIKDLIEIVTHFRMSDSDLIAFKRRYEQSLGFKNVYHPVAELNTKLYNILNAEHVQKRKDIETWFNNHIETKSDMYFYASPKEHHELNQHELWVHIPVDRMTTATRMKTLTTLMDLCDQHILHLHPFEDRFTPIKFDFHVKRLMSYPRSFPDKKRTYKVAVNWSLFTKYVHSFSLTYHKRITK